MNFFYSFFITRNDIKQYKKTSFNIIYQKYLIIVYTKIDVYTIKIVRSRKANGRALFFACII